MGQKHGVLKYAVFVVVKTAANGCGAATIINLLGAYF